jgi:hypothetical protein
MDHQPVFALLVIAIGVSLVVFNFFGVWIARYFSTLFFLDTVGTAIAGLKFGVLASVLIAILSLSQFLIVKSFRQYLKFFYVPVVSGLIWGVIKDYYPVPSGKDYYPVPSGPELMLISYIFVVGGIVGLISTALSVPRRIFLLQSQNTDHLFDEVDRKILKDNKDSQIFAWTKIFCSELLLGHLPDRILSTTVGVLVVAVTTLPSEEKLSILTTMYHDHVEFLAGYYYVALAFVVKSFRVPLVEKDPIIVLAGPLGFFSLLVAFPILLRLVIPLLELIPAS